MSLGQLSSDQAAYVDAVAKNTGLNRDLVAAWVGQESGWGTFKPGHNYLNIGPGHAYGSTDQAAGAASSLLSSSSLYAGIRNAIPAGPTAQARAIEASPWDAGHYGGTAANPGHNLENLYSQLAGPGGSISVTDPNGPTAVQADLPAPLTAAGNLLLPGLGSIANQVGKLTGLDKTVTSAVAQVSSLILEAVFVAAGLGLVALGLARLTGNNPKDLFAQVSDIKDKAGQAAALAALA